MSKTDYFAKLKDPRWQRKRLEILQRDKFHCLICGDGLTELHVHHLYYVTGREPWDYPMSSLQTLCKPCHRQQKEQSEEGSVVKEWESVLGVFGANGNYFDALDMCAAAFYFTQSESAKTHEVCLIVQRFLSSPDAVNYLADLRMEMDELDKQISK